MRKVLFLLFAFVMVSTVKAQTIEVSGVQNGIWDSDTIMVVGDVSVPAGNSLRIMEGTNVFFKGFYKIEVEGAFEAIGCEDDLICFTACDTTGFHIWNYGKGGWNGLTLRNIESPVVLEYCHFSFGKAAEEDKSGGALRIYNVDDISIKNCTFYHNFTRQKGGALYAENSVLEIRDCEVDGNLGNNEDGEYMHGGGFQFLKCDVNMEDMYFHDNYCSSCYGGGVNFDSCNVVFNKAVFENNYAVNAGGIGIQRSLDLDVRVSNILLTNNIVYHYGGAMAIATSSPLIQNVTMVNNYCIGAGGGAMQFYDHANPVFKNCIIWGNDWYENNFQGNSSQIFIWGANCAPCFYNSVLEGGLDDVYGNMYVKVYEDMVETDPMFVDTVAGDFRLKEGSPAINAGTADTTGLYLPETDLAGLPRILGGVVDMGCYEYSGVSVPEVSYKERNVKLYPNPISINSICEIELQDNTAVTLKIYSQSGALIGEKDCGMMTKGKNIISLADLIAQLPQNNNIYFLSIETQDNTYNTKFVY